MFTNAGNLGCQEILHVVGPQWKGGSGKEKDLLQTAVFNILTMVSERKYLSVMIPAISCGVFGYPNDRATYDIVEAIEKYLLHVSISKHVEPPHDKAYKVSYVTSDSCTPDKNFYCVYACKIILSHLWKR